MDQKRAHVAQIQAEKDMCVCVAGLSMAVGHNPSFLPTNQGYKFNE